MHERTKFRLHSHDVPYCSGSGQQSVSGFPNVDNAISYWIDRPDLGKSAKQGDSIPTGTIIRLQHMKTRKWLHSHLYASPISGNLEVSYFGGESESDSGDHWRRVIKDFLLHLAFHLNIQGLQQNLAFLENLLLVLNCGSSL